MIIAVIPARSGSKGIFNKNIQILGDKPLLAWSIDLCLNCPSIDRVIVSTDSQEYADIATEYGAEVTFLRPSSISGYKSTDLEFIEHLISYLQISGCVPDLLLHMRPTTPFRESQVVEAAIDIFQSSTEATSCRSMHKMSESAYKSLLVDSNGYVKTMPYDEHSFGLEHANRPRQSFPDTYTGNGYVDILRPSVISETGTLYGRYCMSFITNSVIEIDEPSDLDMARRLLHVGLV